MKSCKPTLMAMVSAHIDLFKPLGIFIIIFVYQLNYFGCASSGLKTGGGENFREKFKDVTLGHFGRNFSGLQSIPIEELHPEVFKWRPQNIVQDDQDAILIFSSLVNTNFRQGVSVKIHLDASLRTALQALSSATLWAYIEVPQKSESAPEEASFIVTTLHNQTITSQTVENKKSQASNGWIEFDITEIAIQHLHGKEDDLTFQIRCKSCGGGSKRIIVNDEYTPTVVYQLRNRARGGRHKRAAPLCQSGTTKCCRQRYMRNFIDSEALDFIIAPRRQQVYKCEGTCNRASADLFTSNYRFLKDAGVSNYGTKTPCCTPVRYSPMDILYYGEDGNITFDKLKDAIIEDCMCQ